MRWAWLLGLVLALDAFAAAPPVPRYAYRSRHDPNGIGKFYLGREIAYVMSHEGAEWLERPERVKEERTDKLMKALALKPGMTVVDMGAGSGYYTFLIAPKVGPKGKVLAVDIQKEMLTLIERRKAAAGVENVEGVLGTEKDPGLKPGTVDLILMVDVYHEFSHPYEMTRRMVESLRPGGKLVFVEYRLEDPRVPIKLVHKMTKKQVAREMLEQPGMRHAKSIDVLPWQHIIVYEKE